MNSPKTGTCTDVLQMLAAYIDREIDADDREAVDRHIAACRSCYSRAEFERLLKQQLAGAGRDEVDEKFQTRIIELLGRFGAEAPDRHPPTTTKGG